MASRRPARRRSDAKETPMTWFLISWQSIIAGVITALALSIIMAVLGVALGFTVVKPTSDHPLSGLGAAFGIWGVFSVLVSLAGGGFVAGMFSGAAGTEHGFMVWATVLLAATLFSGVALGTAVRTVGSAVKTVGSGAATVASTIGGGVSTLASGIAGSASDHLKDLKESIHIDYDFHNLGDDVTSVLKDTGVETLQPEYLKSQMQEAKDDLKSSFKELHMNTDKYHEIISNFLDKEKSRLEGITNNVDKETAVTTLMKHRGLTHDEAAKSVDNALAVYDRAVDKAKASVAHAQEQLDAASRQVKAMSDHARARAEDMASTAARSALAAAVALILGAFVCCYAGLYGSRLTAERTVAMLRERGVEFSVQGPDVTVIRPGE